MSKGLYNLNENDPLALLTFQEKNNKLTDFILLFNS